MLYLADTTVLIGNLKGRVTAKEYVRKVMQGEIEAHISSITVAEIYHGMKKAKDPRLEETLTMLSFFPVEEVTEEIAAEGGTLFAIFGHYMGKCNPEDKRQILDALIAATAKLKGMTLITSNYKHFEQIEKNGHISCEPYSDPV